MFLFHFFLSCCSRAAHRSDVNNFSEVCTVFQISPTPSIKLLSSGDLIRFSFLLVLRSCSSCKHAQELKFKPTVTLAIALSSLTYCNFLRLFSIINAHKVNLWGQVFSWNLRPLVILLLRNSTRTKSGVKPSQCTIFSFLKLLSRKRGVIFSFLRVTRGD